jgi:hypothetical protein
MPVSSRLRVTLMALIVAFTGTSLATTAKADNGRITFQVIKGGWIIGASAGSGTLYFHGRAYPISIGGISAGFVFGGSATNFRGTVTNIYSPSDVTGVYGAAGAGAAAGIGAQAIVLRNEKGATLALTGTQVGLQINVDLSGMSITVH